MANLEMQVNKTQAGLYTVTYGRKEAPLDVQKKAFAANGLEIVSPAQLGFLRAKEGKGTFNSYSRTNADVFYDDRNNKVVIVPDEAISKLVGIGNLVDAQLRGKEYVIRKNQRGLVYAMVDKMLKSGIAFIVPFGKTTVQTSKFGENDLTSRLYSDKSLGIEAQEYGDWLQSQGRNANSFFIYGERYSREQKAPYLSSLEVDGPIDHFCARGYGGGFDCSIGAFGVRFEKAAEGGAKK